MEKILVSACLVGAKVRYDGADNWCDNTIIGKWIAQGRVVTVCPEVASGCPVPRPPVEIVGEQGGAGVFKGMSRILTQEKVDLSYMFVKGAEIALNLALQENIRIAVLKSRSPSCGSSKIYDGSFSGAIVEGDGVTVSLLRQNRIEIYTEEEIFQAAERLKIIENL